MKKTIPAGTAPTVPGRIVRPRPRDRATLSALAMLALLCALSLHAQPVPVLQRGYDANVSGVTLNETKLNTSNVVEDRRQPHFAEDARGPRARGRSQLKDAALKRGSAA
jgi:hypothetical protein